MTTFNRNRRSLALPSLSLYLLARLCTLALAQTTIHVPADQPTIQAAIDAAQNGDTVLVAPGTYTESIDFKGKGITVTSGATAYTNAGAVILQAPATGATVTLHSGEPAAATLNGFVITHGNDGTGTQYMGNGIDLANSSGTFTNNVVQGNAGCAVSAFKSPTLVLQGNWLTGQHEPPIGGIEFDCAFRDYALDPQLNYFGVGFPAVFVFWSGNATITGNLIENNDSYGLNGIIDDYTATNLIENNIVRNNSFAGHSGIIVTEPQTVTIVQNAIYGNSTVTIDPLIGEFVAGSATAIGVQLSPETIGPVNYSPATATVLNNTVFHNLVLTGGVSNLLPEAFSLEGSNEFTVGGNNVPANTFVGTTIANNLFLTSDTPDSAAGCFIYGSGNMISFRHDDSFGGMPSPFPCSTTPTDGGNLTVDPQFVSPSTFDLHTVRSSPVVAAGDVNVSPLPATDMDGKNRTVCGTIDMGVYEVHPQPPIALTSSPNPSVGGSNATFSVQLTGNCNTPTGLVTFLDGNTPLGTATLSSTAGATFSTAALTVGTHLISATYPGDFNFDPSASNTVTQIVTGYPTATTLDVAPNPASALQTIALSATVTSQFGIPNGTVTFYAGTTPLANATLDASGHAQAAISTLGAGTYALTAVYNPTTQYAASTSPLVTEVVTGATTSTALAAAPNPSTYGQPVTFTATVTAPRSTAPPNGSIVFKDGTATLGQATLNASGIATLSTANLSVGTHAIAAAYAGSANDNPSTSPTVSQIVNPAPVTLLLSASPDPANQGQSVAIAAAIQPALPGPIVFQDTFQGQTATIGTANLVNGQAAISTSTLALGTHSLTAVFAASGNYASATSPAVAETVEAHDFSIDLSPAAISTPGGPPVHIAISLASLGSYNGTLNLTATQLPQYTGATFAPATIALTPGKTLTSTLTLTTAQPPPGLGQNQPLQPTNIAWASLLCLPLLIRRRRRAQKLLATLIAAAFLATATGCTNMDYPLNLVAPGTYTIPVAATDPATGTTHTADLTLIIAP